LSQAALTGRAGEQNVAGWRRWWPDAAALGVLALVLGVFFAPVLFQGRSMPEGGGDLAGFLYPLYNYTVDSLRAGRIPLWNPFLYSGSPFLADIQTATFYPLTLAQVLLPGAVDYRRLEMLSIFHFWLAGALMYALLRVWFRPALSRWAALPGAVAFALSDLFFTHFGNLNLIASAAWLPLILLGARLGGGPGILIGATALALSALAGHTQPVLHSLLALALYGVFALAVAAWAAWRKRGAEGLVDWGLPDAPTTPGQSARLTLVTLLGITALGLGLAALTLAPAYELTGLTRRASFTYADAALYSLPVQGVIGLVAPHLHGRGPAGFWADWPRVEVGYVGVLTLLLAAVGLTRGRRATFWALLGALGLLLALGPATPLHEWFYRFVPGMAQLRAPARLILLVDIGLAALAALGLDTLLRAPRRVHAWLAAAVAVALGLWLLVAWQGLPALGRPTLAQLATAQRGLWQAALLLGASVALIALAAWGRLRGAWLGGLAVALLAVDLLAQGYGVDVGTADPTANYAHPAAIEFLKSDASQYRIEVRSESWGAWPPNLSLLRGIEDVGGIYNPLQVADYQLYFESLTDRATRLYDFLNAKYVIGPKDFALPWDRFAPVFDADPEVNIYLNRAALPRAQVVYRSRVIPDSAGQFAALRAPGFDPAQEVILGGGEALAGPNAGNGVTFADYQPERIIVDVDAAADGYVVFSEVAYPGWQAMVDGVPVPIERANFAFRAVRVPPGTHRVELVFEPTTWRLGLAISLASVAALLGVAWWAWRAHRQRRMMTVASISSVVSARDTKAQRRERRALSLGCVSVWSWCPWRCIRAEQLPYRVAAILLLSLVAACAPTPPPTPTATSPAPTTPPTAAPPTATPSATPALTAQVFLPVLPAAPTAARTPTPAPTLDPRAPRPLPTAISLGRDCAGLIVARDGGFWRDGRPWTFVGTNLSYLSKLPLDAIDEAFAALAADGVTVVRTWILPGHDLDHLDSALALGRKHGLRFVVTFDDFWHIDRGQPLFGEAYRQTYEAHLQRVVSRLKDRPEVFMWQLMNEPSCGPEGMSAECRARMVAWAEAGAKLVRSQDSCRPLAVGLLGIWVPDAVQEEHFARMAHIPGVDTMTLHRAAGGDFDDLLKRHMGVVLEKAMPLVWGEIYEKAYDGGCQELPDDAVRRRARTIRRDLARSFDAGVDGYLLWQYAYGQLRVNGKLEYFCGEYDYERDDPVWVVLRAFDLPTPR